MREKRREPEVPEERVPVVECLDGLARITSKELAITRFVKSGTLQNACSTGPRVVVGLVKSALMHITRLMNSLAKRSKKSGDKSAVAMLKKYELHDRTWQHVVKRDTRHELFTDLLGADHRIHDIWVVYFKIWSRRRPQRFCGRAQTYGNRSDVFDSRKPCCVVLTFETKIHRLE